MLLILQTLVLLTVQTPFLQGESPFQLQSETINDLGPITAHIDLDVTKTLPGRSLLDFDYAHAFLSADGSSQTSASILERLRELLRITHRKLRRIRHGSSNAMGVATAREGWFGQSANGPLEASLPIQAFSPIVGIVTRTDPRFANRFEIDPIRPRAGWSQCWRSNSMASQWMKPSSRFRTLGKEPFPIFWWQRG